MIIFWTPIMLTALRTKDTISAILLVAGCCIGAGMIGMPVLTVLAGFMPSTFAMIACYLFTTLTGLLLLEAILWFDGQVNLPTLVEQTLGRTGKFITLILFLFLFYCIFVAYLDGGGLLISEMAGALIHHPVNRIIGILLCTALIITLTLARTETATRMNRILVLGMILSCLLLVSVALPHVHETNLTFVNWAAGLGTLPILLICFGYQNLVPTLVTILNKNINAIRCAIIIGNLVPLVFYSLWNFVILGMLSPHTQGTTHEASMVTELLQGTSSHLPIIFFTKAFSLFAILTSFLPSAISFIDFLKDGAKKIMPTTNMHDYFLCAIVFVPPLIFTLFYPRLFLRSLEFAGGFIDVLLFGVLPALVIMIGRNYKKMGGPYQVMGGNITPPIVLIISISIILFKLFN